MDTAGTSRDGFPLEAKLDGNFIKAWKTENEQPVYSIEHYAVRWSIEKLSLLTEKEHKAVLSPIFVLDISQTEWLLSWNPSIFRNGQKCSLFCIQRCRGNRGSKSVGITFRIGVSNSDNTTVWFDERKVNEFEENCTVQYWISDTEQLEILTKIASPESDVFLVNCEMYICHEIKREVRLSVADYDLVNLSYDFTKLIRSKESSDYCIRIPHWDIVTHKAILIARSSYFENAIVENIGKTCIELSDVSYNNITSLLLFMYSANFNLVAKNGPPDIGFYECAQRFDVPKLAKLLTPKELHVKTKLKPVELEFTWFVENFSRRLTGENNSIISPPFSASSIDSPLWTLTINTICSSGALSGFDIFAEVDMESEILFSVLKISLLDRNGALQNTKTTTQPYAAGMKFGFPLFLTQFSTFNKTHGFLQNDTLKVHCHITFVVSSGIYERHDVFRSERSDISLYKDLSDNLRKIYKSGILTDATLKSNGPPIKAHWSVLFARSRTFASKFLYDAKENILEIKDLDKKFLPFMVEYAYTGTFRGISTEDMVPLLNSSYNFCFRSLSMVSAEFAGQGINLENFYELVKLSSKLENFNLLYKCSKFARKNAKTIAGSPEFETLRREDDGAYDFLNDRIYAIIRRQ